MDGLIAVFVIGLIVGIAVGYGIKWMLEKP